MLFSPQNVRFPTVFVPFWPSTGLPQPFFAARALSSPNRRSMTKHSGLSLSTTSRLKLVERRDRWFVPTSTSLEPEACSNWPEPLPKRPF